MQMIDAVLDVLMMNSVLLFVVIFVLMLGSALVGKYLFKERLQDDALADDDSKIVLGALLSLLFLLMGFSLSIAISGYNAREQTEEQEAIVIANAIQNTEMLTEADRQRAYPLLKDYLETRIAFFNSGSHIYSSDLQRKSIEIQKALWKIALEEARTSTVNGYSLLLTSYTELYNTQARTTAGWRDLIPGSAWVLLIILSISANYFIGHNIRGVRGRNTLIMILPTLTTLALFMISEIDVPGEGVIYVVPDNLIALNRIFIPPVH